MQVRVCCLLLISLSFFLPLLCPGRVGAQGERLVLAFYYAWFDMATWDQPLPDQPVQPYASTNPAAVERHVLWAQQGGIDAFIQSWYGPQVEDNQTEPNFALLLHIAEQHGFAAAVDFEVTGPFIHSEADVAAALQHLLAVHAVRPAYLRLGGKPVIFFWRQNQYPVETWYAIRDQVDPQRNSIWIMEGTDLDYLGPFDGNYLYSVAWDAAPEGVLVRWGQGVREWGAANGSSEYWVATVMPGYDDRVTGRADAFVRERAGGEYYRRCWEGAIQSGADLVVVTSFNEWMEGTQIEPSVGYGDFYLSLTKELADLYRVGGPPAATATPIPADTPTTSPTDTPTVTPTVTSTPAPTSTPTATQTPTVTPSPTPTSTASPTPTQTPTAAPTVTPTLLPTPTPTPFDRAFMAARGYPELVLAGLALLLGLAAFMRFRRG